eukprot:11238831-Karenia_brevis.AAC.1
MAEKLGLRAGFAWDLSEKDHDGATWDLSKPKMQQRAITKLKDERPWLLIVSPPCTPFSSLQWWNFPRMERDEVHKLFEDGLQHLAFA